MAERKRKDGRKAHAGNWAPGVSGNPKGRAAEKPIRDAIWSALQDYDAKDGRSVKKIHLLAESIVDRAIDGDVAAAKVVIERIDGKPIQKVEVDLQAPVQELPDDVLMGIIQHFRPATDGHPDATDAKEGPAGPN